MTPYPFFQEGGEGIAILLPVSVFVTSLIWEDQNLPAYKISARYLNPRLRYYYFRFLKTNVRHVGIIFPVPNFTFASPSSCHSASAYQISSKSDHPWQSYDVIAIFKDGGRQPYWIISRLLRTTHEVQMGVWGWSSNFDSIGFKVSKILLSLCYDVLAWNWLFAWLKEEESADMYVGRPNKLQWRK